MNRGVIWLLVIAVIAVGIFLWMRNNGDADDNVQDKAEDIQRDTEDMGRDLTDSEEDVLSDGEFSGKTDTDDHGNYGTIEITVEDGKITAASYTEYQETGPKDENYPYQLALQAIPKLEEDLIEKQDPDDVDTISGATGTSEKFRVAAKRALEQAQ